MSDDNPPPELRIVELESRLADMEARTNQRLIHSELKSQALRAGIVDLDALKLIETDGLEIDESGNLAGAAKLIADLKRNKPYLFGPANTSTPLSPPPTAPPSVKRATQMTHAEWQSARSELLRRR